MELSSILIPLASSQQNLYDLYLLPCVQCWTPDDGQRYCPKHVKFYSKNKFEKLVHLVVFITRIHHDARSYKCQILWQFFIYFSSLQCVINVLPFNPTWLNILRVFREDYKLWGFAISRNLLTLIPLSLFTSNHHAYTFLAQTDKFHVCINSTVLNWW